MTWAEFAAARKLQLEERVGKLVRQAKAAEDEQAAGLISAVAKRERHARR